MPHEQRFKGRSRTSSVAGAGTGPAREDDDHHIDGEDVGEIKLAEDRRNRRWHIYQSVYFREYEESVQTHTRSQSERFLGIDRHHECTHNGSQYGGSEYSVCIHALSGEMTEDVRVTARI